jgi:predicted nucleic acid-binding protein
MLDLTRHSPRIERSLDDADEWFRPVIDNGRGAAFVDTSFLIALISADDQFHDAAERLFDNSTARYYTTAMVVAEAVRQIVKGANRAREGLLERCTEFVLRNALVVVCSPPREFVLQSYREFIEIRGSIDVKLDFGDYISMAVLDYARHRRVFGFDRRHFTALGALLEP